MLTTVAFTLGATDGLAMRHATPAGLIHRWLLIPVYVAWVAVFSVVIAFLVVGLPARLHQLSIPCSESSAPAAEPCARYQLSEIAEQVLADWGLSLSTYAWYVTGLTIVSAPILLLLASVIFLRSRGQLASLTPSFGLILFVPGYFVSISEALKQEQPGWIVPLGLLQVMAFWFGVLFGFTFPGSTLFPRWTRALMLVATATTVAMSFYAPVRLFTASGPRGAYWLSFATVALLASAVWAQISRYRQTSNAVERQQTKWVVFGFTILVLDIGVTGMAPLLLPVLREPGRGEMLYSVTNVTFSTIVPVLLAASFAVAILRYRLFDIDIIINRTLVYGASSVSLAAVYVGGILLCGLLLRPVTRESDLAVAISTLAVAALFQPIRRRIQSDVDRRFFRRKFDAEQAIAAFRTMSRNEVDLDRLSSAVAHVARETMQPSFVSVWLRKR